MEAKYVNAKRIDERLSIRAATKWVNEHFNLGVGVGVLLHAPVNLRHAHKAYPRLQKETCASTSLLALLNNTCLGKVFRQPWDLSKVFCNRFFRGWSNEH